MNEDLEIAMIQASQESHRVVTASQKLQQMLTAFAAFAEGVSASAAINPFLFLFLGLISRTLRSDECWGVACKGV